MGNDLFQALVEHGHDAVLLLDAQGRIQWASQSTARVLGYAPSEVAGLSVLSLMHDDDLRTSEGGLEDCLAHPGRELDLEVRMRHRYGSWRLTHTVLTNRLDHPSVGAVIASVRDVTERGIARERMWERLEHDAAYDPLTGLVNRRLLRSLIDNAIARGRRQPDYRFAILFIDLDGFKDINDRYGHRAGDRLLAALARRLGATLRPGDTLARLMGDEFAILLEGVHGTHDAALVAGRVQRALAAPFDVDGREVVVRASIGIALGPAATGGADDVLHDADGAMYRGKSAGGDRVVIGTSPPAPEAPCPAPLGKAS